MKKQNKKEIELIEFYNATDRRYGYNVLIGGNCTQHPSEETRRKVAEKNRGRKMPDHVREALRIANQNRVISEETRRRMSEAAKNRPRRTMSEEAKKKIGDAHRGRKYSDEYRKIMSDRAEKMPVKQFDTRGNFICEYESITAASKNLNISKSRISDCCKKKPKYKTVGGFQWRFADDLEPVGVVENPKSPKEIVQKDFDGNILAVYPSAAEANEATGFDSSSISKCARGKLKHYKGYFWEYSDSLN